jgi:hypothetical protein
MRFRANRFIIFVGLLALWASGCGGAAEMRGFPARDARAQERLEMPKDGCAVRTGNLVIEVERLVIREYPTAFGPDLRLPKMPLLLLWLRSERGAGRQDEAELSVLAAPEDYLANDPVHFFEGKRLLERPIRAISGRQIELRVARNERTMTPRWVEIAHLLAGGASGAAARVGISVPASTLDTLIELIRQLDLDDLILIWSTSTADLMAPLASPARLARVHLSTPRQVKDEVGAAKPSVELDLLVYIEPEPGCL